MTPVEHCAHETMARDYWQREGGRAEVQRLDLYCATCTECGTTRALVEVWAQRVGPLSPHEQSTIDDLARRAKRRSA